MDRKKLSNGFKIIFIIILVLVIALVSVIQWKGDAIAAKVIVRLESQLEAPLVYESLHLEWFGYFPSIALRIGGLKLGPDEEPLIEGGHVDIVLRLFPLIREKVIINRLIITDSHLNIIRRNSKWSYEVFKKTSTQNESDWKTLVRQVNLENTRLVYNDHENLSLSLDISHAMIEGTLSGKWIEADIEMQGSLTDLISGSYKLPSPFSFRQEGNYRHDLVAGTQKYSDWKINNDAVDIRGNGSTRKEKDHEFIEADISWNGDAEIIKQIIPDKNKKDWDGYVFSGNTEGRLIINGKSSGNGIPHIACTSQLKNGSIKFGEEEESLRNITLDMTYDNGVSQTKKKSFINVILHKGSFRGHSIKGDIRVDDLDRPELTMKLEGSLSAGLLNVFTSSSGMRFQDGVFEIDRLITNGLRMNTFSLTAFIEKSEADFSMEKIKFAYNDNIVEISQGEIHLDHSGKMELAADRFTWNRANAEDVKGTFEFISDKVDYEIKGSICQGDVESKGNISALGARPVMNADWKMKGVEIKEVMASFENFGQTFITDGNIKGKSTIWAHAIIPYDASGEILSKEVLVRAAIHIKDGELKDLKTLEDFSRYIHLDDLRDIRFNEFRNYVKIEDGKVYLPVMFLQSSAMNMSVNGVHGFDQHILYNLKINAGQAAANKLRKLDASKHFKQARKSGWINLYYVLSGTSSSVRYEQDQREVLSGFEQSAALKESLRSYLVDRFGYDVYWLEPNEWEDIPEYR